jgi:hypothetical protein
MLLKDVCMFVFVNSVVMIHVSFLVYEYVKVAQVCLFFGCVFSSLWFGLHFLWCLYMYVGSLGGSVRKLPD